MKNVRQSVSEASGQTFVRMGMVEGGFVCKTFSRASDGDLEPIQLIESRLVSKNTFEYQGWRDQFDRNKPHIYATFTFKSKVETKENSLLGVDDFQSYP